MSNTKIINLLKQETFSKDDLVYLLSFYNKKEKKLIYEKAKEVKLCYVGNKIYLRGLIEYSNKCTKDCFYCGIRNHNHKIERYTLSDDEVLKCVDYAYENKYASIVIQSGETTEKAFIDKITLLLRQIHKQTGNSLRVTLSCGEQTFETYKTWFDAGAKRYLLRIESSNKALYESIHPKNENHSFEKRLQALKDLQSIGYQVGSGIMIGLPYQNIEHLADDLLFLRDINIDMVGMGPYVEHTDTPMVSDKHVLLSKQDRYDISLMMYALLRILLKDINIASATALDAIHENGRFVALNIACNVLMPNLTPDKYLSDYHLYNNKPEALSGNKLLSYIENNKTLNGNNIAFGEKGDSLYYLRRIE